MWRARLIPKSQSGCGGGGGRRRAEGGGVEGMDIEKIHSVSGSLVTEVRRHQVALAQVHTQESNDGKRGRLERGKRFRNISERNRVIVLGERRVRSGTAGGDYQ